MADQGKGNNEASEKRKTILVLISLMLLFCFVSLVCAFFCDAYWPYRLTITSPSGEYVLEQRYTDRGGWGYRSRTYLLVNGKYYRVDEVGPGYAGWKDDVTFFVYETTYTVSDFTDP